MKVAMVGAHGSTFDISIFADVLRLIPEAKKAAKFDLIDLRNGRDFLKETGKYDVVVLCYIFLSTLEEQRNDPLYPLTRLDPTHLVSPLHSPETWRRRLLTCEAREILVFGYYTGSEVTGEYLGELSGYKQTVIEEEQGTIWRYGR